MFLVKTQIEESLRKHLKSTQTILKSICKTMTRFQLENRFWSHICSLLSVPTVWYHALHFHCDISCVSILWPPSSQLFFETLVTVSWAAVLRSLQRPAQALVKSKTSFQVFSSLQGSYTIHTNMEYGFSVFFKWLRTFIKCVFPHVLYDFKIVCL